MVTHFATVDQAVAFHAHRKRLRYRANLATRTTVGEVFVKIPLLVKLTVAIVIALVAHFILRDAVWVDVWSTISRHAAVTVRAITETVRVDIAARCESKRTKRDQR